LGKNPDRPARSGFFHTNSPAHGFAPETVRQQIGAFDVSIYDSMFALAKRILATLASGIYLASPLDLIPDLIPAFGLTDDAAVLLLALYYWHTLLRETRKHPRPEDARILDIEPAEPNTP
jgi:hypothetical protein